MRVIFFGAGNYARNVWKQISENGQLYNDEYIAFADNNPDLWGKSFCGRNVINPVDIKKYKADLIVITSIYEKAICDQLKEELGICKKQISLYIDYSCNCCINNYMLCIKDILFFHAY